MTSTPNFPSSANLVGNDVFLPLPAANDNLWRPFDRDDLFTSDPELRRFADPDECRNIFYSERGERDSIFPPDLTYKEYDATYNKLARLSVLLDGADKHLHVTEIERAVINIVGHNVTGGSSDSNSNVGSKAAVVYVYIANKNGYKHVLPSGCVKCVVTIWIKGSFGRDCVHPIENLIDAGDRGLLRVLGRTLRVIQVAAPPVLNAFINGIQEYRALHGASKNRNNSTETDTSKTVTAGKTKGAWTKPLAPDNFATLSSPSATDKKDLENDKLNVMDVDGDHQNNVETSNDENVAYEVSQTSSTSKRNEAISVLNSDTYYSNSAVESDLGSSKQSDVEEGEVVKSQLPEQEKSPQLNQSEQLETKSSSSIITNSSIERLPDMKSSSSAGKVSVKAKSLSFADESDSASAISNVAPAPDGLLRPEFHYERLSDSIINDCLLPLFSEAKALKENMIQLVRRTLIDSLVHYSMALSDQLLLNSLTSIPMSPIGPQFSPLPKPLYTHHAINQNANIHNSYSNLIFYQDHRIITILSPYFRYRVPSIGTKTSLHSERNALTEEKLSSNSVSYYGLMLAAHDHLEDLWQQLCHLRFKLLRRRQLQQQKSTVSRNRRSNDGNDLSSSQLRGPSRTASMRNDNNGGTDLDRMDVEVVDEQGEQDESGDEAGDNYADFEDTNEEFMDEDDDASNQMTEKERLELLAENMLMRATAVVVRLYQDSSAALHNANSSSQDTSSSGGKISSNSSTSATANTVISSSTNNNIGAFCSLTQETMCRNVRGRPGVLEYLYIGKYLYPIPTGAPPSMVNSPSRPMTSKNSTTPNTTNVIPSASTRKYRDILVTELPILNLRQIIDYLQEQFPLSSMRNIEEEYALSEAKFTISKAICLALSSLHVGENMVHRDLRPETIVVLMDGTLKLADFNLSRRFALNSTPAASAHAAGSALTSHSSNMYTAPEVLASMPIMSTLAQDERFMIITKAGDIYGLGIILYELFTHGEHPSSMHIKKLHHPFYFLQHPDRNTNTNTTGDNAMPPTTNPAVLWPPLAHIFLTLHQPWLLHLLHHCIDDDPALRPNITQILRHPFYLTFSQNFDVLLVRELNEVLIRDYHAVYDAAFVKRLRLLKPIESLLNYLELPSGNEDKTRKNRNYTFTNASNTHDLSDSTTNLEDGSVLSSYYYRHHPAGQWMAEVNNTKITTFITLGREYIEPVPDVIHGPNNVKITNSLASRSGNIASNVDLLKSPKVTETDSDRNTEEVSRGNHGHGDAKSGGSRFRDNDRRSGSRSNSFDRSRGNGSYNGGGGHKHYNHGDRYYDNDFDDDDEPRRRGRGRRGPNGDDYDVDEDDSDGEREKDRRRNAKNSKYSSTRDGSDSDSTRGSFPKHIPNVISSASLSSPSNPSNTANALYVPYPLPKLSLFIRFLRNLKMHYHGLPELQSFMRAMKRSIFLPMRNLLKMAYATYYARLINPTPNSVSYNNEELLEMYVQFFRNESLDYVYPGDVFTHHPGVNWLMPEIWRQSVRQYRAWKKEGEEIEARRQQELEQINVFANL